MEQNTSPLLSPPWITYVRQLNALFGQDPDIRIDDNADNFEVKLFVKGQKKADAIAKLLPAQKSFGNIFLRITVVPDNSAPTFNPDLFKDAFNGNPAFDSIVEMPMPFSQTSTAFVLFKPEVVQFFNDDISDPYGNATTLYQNLAEEVFGNNHDGIFFSTTPIKAEEAKHHH